MGPLNPSGYSFDLEVGCTHVCSLSSSGSDSLSVSFVLFFVVFFVLFFVSSLFSSLLFSLSFESSGPVVVDARGRLRPPAPCVGLLGLMYFMVTIHWVRAGAACARTHRRKIQVKHSIGSNFGHMTLPVLNLPTRWCHIKIQIEYSIRSNFGY